LLECGSSKPAWATKWDSLLLKQNNPPPKKQERNLLNVYYEKLVLQIF
jgi:hypothetical protein